MRAPIRSALRRTFAWRQPASRQECAITAGICLVPALVIFAATGAEEVKSPPAASGGVSQPGPEMLNGLQAHAASVPPESWLAIAALIVPFLFALIRRSNDLGIPRWVSILGAAVLVVSTISVLFSIEEAIQFPATRSLWALLTDGTDDLTTKVLMGVLFSFLFLFTLAFDALVMALIGLVALVAMILSAAGALVVACLPGREVRP